jgi:aldehyde:ferredoxin oxidoreductase
VKECAKLWCGDAVKYALHVKGMETVATDPRGQPSWGLGYATSSRGACHMRAYGNFEYGGMSDEGMMKIAGTTSIADRYSLEGKGKAVAYLEDMHAFGDSLGTCKFMTRAELGFPEALIDVLNTATGLNLSPEELYTVGERIYNLERISNLQRGLTPADDTLPDRYLNEPVSQGPAQGKVCELQPMMEEYYFAREWDPENGYPSQNKLTQIKLDKFGQDVN